MALLPPDLSLAQLSGEDLVELRLNRHGHFLESLLSTFLSVDDEVIGKATKDIVIEKIRLALAGGKKA